ncbi:MAG TPA: VWA domain-containing protein, partial [bacterium]|nr:VWA domain-containing protein [bacterium]
DKVDEVTGFFRERKIGRAVARALAEANVDPGARTDYGASFRDFDRRFGRVLNRRTTLVILGDARSNYTDPGYEILRSWKRKVKRIVFLNPEAPIFWGSGDSVMPRYRALCDVVAECRTPKHLLAVVEALAGRGTPRLSEPPPGLPRF